MGRVVNNHPKRVFLSIGRVTDQTTGKSKAQFVERFYKRDENGNFLRDAEGKRIIDHEESCDALTGYLTAISFQTAGEGKKQFETLNVQITDGDEVFVVSVGKTDFVTENIVYALDSVQSFAGKVLTWQVWLDTYNGKEYIRCGFRFGEEKISWSVAPKDRPATKRVVINGKEQIDRGDRLADMEARVASIQHVLAAQVSAPQRPVEPQLEQARNEEAQNQAALNEPPYENPEEEGEIPW